MYNKKRVSLSTIVDLVNTFTQSCHLSTASLVTRHLGPCTKRGRGARQKWVTSIILLLGNNVIVWGTQKQSPRGLNRDGANTLLLVQGWVEQEMGPVITPSVRANKFFSLIQFGWGLEKLTQLSDDLPQNHLLATSAASKSLLDLSPIPTQFTLWPFWKYYGPFLDFFSLLGTSL